MKRRTQVFKRTRHLTLAELTAMYEHAEWALETLAPDLHESGHEYTAEDVSRLARNVLKLAVYARTRIGQLSRR